MNPHLSPYKILVIGYFGIEDFALHIAETLAEMGHAVRRFEAGRTQSRLGQFSRRAASFQQAIHEVTDRVPSIRAARARRLWREVDRGPLDVVIVCHDLLLPEEVTELRRRSKAMVTMWFPDHIANLVRGYCINAPYDALFFKDPFIVAQMRGVLRTPVFYLPECFNPRSHRIADGQPPGEEHACDLTTAGNMHSWRTAIFSQLREFDVRAWGHPAPLWMPPDLLGPAYQGRPVYNSDKARAFLGAKIVVNSLYYGEVWGINVRAFEAAGVGSFQLIDWRPGLAQLFEPELEIVAYRGIAELKEKIKYWLPRNDDRRAIAEAGMRRAHSEHTYRHRLDLLLATLAGRERGFPVSLTGMDEQFCGASGNCLG
jgi:spore maturation protein CgeB